MNASVNDPGLCDALTSDGMAISAFTEPQHDLTELVGDLHRVTEHTLGGVKLNCNLSQPL